MGGSFVDVGVEVGRVAAMWRYPVKSMAPDAVAGADVSWHGMAGDRRWAFVRDRSVHSGFPWLTLRDRPGMIRYRPRFGDPRRPDSSPVVVTTPAGVDLDVTDPALAAELGPGVRAMRLDRGTFDALPVSLITIRSIRRMEAAAGRLLEVERFRPNLLIEAHDAADAFPEDGWTGATLRIGDALVRVDARDQRCVVVNIDPTTAERDPTVFRTIVAQRKARLGAYATTTRPGHIAVGDPVLVAALPLPDQRPTGGPANRKRGPERTVS